MDIETITATLLWCSLINYGILLLWFACFSLAYEWLYRLHSQWFLLSPEQFSSIHYSGMAFYKIVIAVFNLVPYIALRIVS
jgi:hypothetical protein